MRFLNKKRKGEIMAKLNLVECVDCGLRMRVNKAVVTSCACEGDLRSAKKIIAKDPARKRKNRRFGTRIAT